MATSVSGLSSIDVNSIVSQLMTVERQPLQALQKTLTGLQTKLSAFGKLQSNLAAFQDAARALKDAETWKVAKASSSDETIARAVASPGALTGGYSLLIEKLAQRQTIASTAYAATDAVVGGGTLQIQLGTYDGESGAFAADPERPAAAITIPANATVSQVRDAINAAGVGVTASLVRDSSGVRLMIRSTESGAQNAFSVSGSGDAGVSALSFTPGSTGGVMAMTQAPQDAIAQVNGLTITSPTNKLDGVIENMVIDLRKASETGAEIDVSPDSDAIRAAVQKFVDAWNALSKTIAEQTKYDAGSKTAGTLQGNSTVVSLQRQLRAMLTSSVDGATLGRLSDAGIELQRDGSLAIKDAKFNAAVANPAKLQSLFSASGAAPESLGLARRLDTLLTSVLGTDGSISAATEGLRSRQEGITRQQEAFEARMVLIEARLRRQYVALDTQLSQMGSTASFLTSRFSQSSN